MTAKKRVTPETVLALSVVALVAVLVVPLPTWLLDILIATNLSISVVLIVSAIYARDALAFTSFPTLLLLTTLFRLSLNISSTRLILLQGDAGHVITAFGEFVVRGNYIVGGIVFVVLTIVQFLVIAKGSERVAEVGARFALDAMPGKQMAIDAELRVGALSQDDARKKRRQLQKENQFYGAMDGAMKFVKGDAIAGIIIAVVNVLGGLAVGVTIHGLSVAEAAQRFALLAIGDGLVSQIPSLLISTAAGITVTRVASVDEEQTLGDEIYSQILGNGQVLRIGAVFSLLLAITPGMPTLPFLVLGGALLWMGQKAIQNKPALKEKPKSRGKLVLEDDPFGQTFGVQWAEGVAELNESLRALGASSGVPLPSFAQELQKGVGTRTLRVEYDGAVLATYPLIDANAMLVASADHPDDSAFVDPVRRLAFRRASNGSTGSAFGKILTDCIVFLIQRRARHFLGVQETQHLIDQLETQFPALVRNTSPKPLSVPAVADVLRRLVDESVSIRPMRDIFEALALHAPHDKDPVSLTESARVEVRQNIVAPYLERNQLRAFLLDPFMEDVIRGGIQRSPAGAFLSLPPSAIEDIKDAVARERQQHPDVKVVLTQSDVRRFFRKAIEGEHGDLAVISYAEIESHIDTIPVARIEPGL